MKLLFTVLLFTGLTQVYAQYTITPSQKPDIGDAYNFITLDTSNIINGSSGANQIWDYTNLILPVTPTVNSTIYSPATDIPNYTWYPGAYMALIASDGTFASYDSDPNNLSMNWLLKSTAGVGCAKYVDTYIKYHYPISYNSVFTDSVKFLTYLQEPPNPHNIGIYPECGINTYTCTGYGTLNLPNGVSYPNTLKLNILYAKTYSNETTQAPWGYDSTYYEEYFNAASKFPILSLLRSVDCFTASISNAPIRRSKQIRLNALAITGLENLTINSSDISIFPNPSKGLVNIQINHSGLPEKPVFILQNTLGCSLKTDPQKLDNGDYRLDLSNYVTGIYFLTIKFEKGQVTKKLLVE